MTVVYRQSLTLFALALSACAYALPAAAESPQEIPGWNSDRGFWDSEHPVAMPSMNYDTEAATKWARHYTREDLEPVPYMDGSASMVMRPRNPDYDHFGKGGKIGDPRGFAAIDRRDYLNRLAGDRPKMYLGDPGTNPYGMFEPDGSGELGQKTMIGRPKQDWRGNPKDGSLGERSAAITPRPGDFDFKDATKLGVKDESQMVYENAPGSSKGGQEIFNGTQPRYDGGAGGDAAGNNGMGDGQQMGMANGMNGGGMNGAMGGGNGNSGMPGSGYDAQGRPMPYGANGNYPERYQVVPGDSLSGISDQEKIYGDWKLWPLIYDANRSQINDPDLIFPGQDLGIPRDYTQSEGVDAQRRAVEKTAPYDFYDGR
ncbi:MAG: hypothetical protein GC134_08075 [Proteobacteria bacterium]|nr:hypothetical protein [Pseudomonadota bacterium]